MEFTDSLKKDCQFRKIYNNGKSIANKNMVLYVMRNELDKNRLGISVSKKVGNSVVRNRVKRLIKENYRLMEHELKFGFDIVVIARAKIVDANFFDVKKSLLHLLTKHSIYQATISNKKNIL